MSDTSVGNREVVAQLEAIEPAVRGDGERSHAHVAGGYIARRMLPGASSGAKGALGLLDVAPRRALMTAIKVPPLGESIVEATVSRWLKKEGDAVAAGDTLVELETDKITVEVPALSAACSRSAHAARATS